MLRTLPLLQSVALFITMVLMCLRITAQTDSLQGTALLDHYIKNEQVNDAQKALSNQIAHY